MSCFEFDVFEKWYFNDSVLKFFSTSHWQVEAMTNNSTWKKLSLLGFLLQFCMIFYLLLTTSKRTSCPACQSISCAVCETSNQATSDVAKMKIQSKVMPNEPTQLTSTHLNYYSLQQFAQRGWMFPVNSKLCVNTKGVKVMWAVSIKNWSRLFISFKFDSQPS